MTVEQTIATIGVEGDENIILRPRKRSIPGQLRTVRRLALLAVTLNACRQSQATLPQLHVLNWAVRTKESRKLFLEFLRGFVAPDVAVVRFDPSLPRTIEYAVSEGIVSDGDIDILPGMEQSQSANYRITLTEKGRDIVGLVEDEGALVDERIFLSEIGKKITQTLIQSLLDWS